MDSSLNLKEGVAGVECMNALAKKNQHECNMVAYNGLFMLSKTLE